MARAKRVALKTTVPQAGTAPTFHGSDAEAGRAPKTAIPDLFNDDALDPASKATPGAPEGHPAAWLFYATEKRSRGSWTKDMQPGRIMFWQHGLAEPERGAASHSRRMRVGDTVVVLTGRRIVATAVLVAAGDMTFGDADNSRWWPILFVDVLRPAIPLERVVARADDLIGAAGSVHPIDQDTLRLISDLAPSSGGRSLPFPSRLAKEWLRKGEKLNDALARDSDIHPDSATASRLGLEAHDPLPRVFNDRADSPDLLDIAPEVRAFARLAISRKVDPPLSVGLFGDWGSGKSFFMEKVRMRIDDLSRRAQDKRDPASGAFHSAVPQIRFNAWHYIETNLWASLVAFIFAELHRWLAQQSFQPDDVNALFDRLATSRELKLEGYRRLIQARKAEQAASTQLEKARVDLRKQLRQPLGAAEIWKASADTVFGDAATRTRLREAAKSLGLDALDDSSETAARLVQDAAREGRRAGLLLGGVVEKAGSFGGAAALLAALGVPLLFALALGLFLRSDAAGVLQQLAAGGAVSLGALTTLGVAALRGARKQLDVLDQLRAKLEEARLEKSSKERAAVAAAERAAADAAGEVAEAEQRLAQARDEVAVVLREQQDLSAVGRLNRFIREKASNGEYARHLGIIASIHKDFGQLSALLRAQDASPDQAAEDALRAADAAYQAAAEAIVADAEAGGAPLPQEQVRDLLEERAAKAKPPEIGRIVLYIDDLDRCPPDKVVEVLQAIHMLLFFPLFVVFVAVDARWLKRSLKVQFPDLLSDRSQPGGGNEATRPADAQDYLEKIFQVPFWVAPMDATQGERFVTSLTQDLVVRRSDADAPAAAARLPAESQADGPPPDDATDEGAGTAATGTAPEEPPELLEINLTAEEQRALAAFGAALGGSPRRTKRFVNTYLLIRTAGRATRSRRASTIWPTVALLAVVVAAREAAGAFFETLDELGGKAVPLGAFRSRLAPALAGPDGDRLLAVLDAIADHPRSFAVAELTRQAPVVKRYAF